MNKLQTIYRLKGAVQHYAWGGTSFIPTLLDIRNANAEPYAEYWMGTHNRGVAKVVFDDGQERNLDLVIADNPPEYLGEPTAERFNNQLPFLLKILDVEKMLSIQAHPNKAEAEIGFAAENAAGIPIDAYNRNFKDDNHKPEMMVALTDFYLLHGFLFPEAIIKNLTQVPEFQSLQTAFKAQGLKPFYEGLMTMPQSEVDALLAPLANRLIPELESNAIEKITPEYWAAKALRDFRLPNGGYDRGVFSIFIMNIVYLQPGEGVYQGAGLLHAYLEGVNVELMANSDTVFRGGLTDKYVDPAVLVAHLDFTPIVPNILTRQALSDTESVFHTPSPDFELRIIDLNNQEKHSETNTSAAAILIVMDGQFEVEAYSAKSGDAFFIPAGTDYSLSCSKKGVIYQATVPV
jgi:mannose-6-phosphate isomerase